MGRYRSRSRSLSYSPRRRSRTPPRDRKRYDDDYYPSHRDRRSPAPSGLLIRNLPLDARPEDLRIPFEKYGPVKDVYLPKNYYTGEPRGFGFVKYRYGEDAAAAKEHMNHRVIGGREIRIVFAEENRKTPNEMRTTSRGSSRHGGSHRRRTPLRSPRRRHHSYSRSPSPARRDSRERGARDDDHSRGRSKSISRSRSPRVEEYRSRKRSLSPRENGHSPNDERNYSPHRSGSPRGDSRGPSRSHSRSYSPR
ncbi:serine/arginine-rich SC35-like splicing factor SCL28 isoform X1 [Tripterygium wilfordii]|uniref:serine/arginine-rich SC35-like splicing factor SCL28 isoform X1 n=1 Tax=Tripterygium wilfordii TaxID=458696 RepID=UPI0018F8010D|nr:serine/arginine-rich SC35-like splicing factor SCL28 isoform X1 [Tripterygium wilfordii]